MVTPWKHRLTKFWRRVKRGVRTVQPSGRVLGLAVAGVMFEGHDRVAARLALGEEICLERHPENPHDPNAIAVVTRRGERFGYVSRQQAAVLAPWIDSLGGSVGASVTELATDFAGTFVGVRVATAVPADLLSHPPALEFDCEEAAGGGLYLLLNCDQATLQGIREELGQEGLPSLRSGMCYRLSQSGRAYRWYVRLGDEVDRNLVERHFTERYGISPGSGEARKAAEQYAETFDRDLAAKRAETELLGAQVDELRTELAEAARKQDAAFGEAADNVLRAIFPEVELIRDSHDVICRELLSLESLLRELHTVVCRGAEVRAGAVRGAEGWRELHYSTGQKDDGRIYFRRTGTKVRALVSFKREQERDIAYLRRQ